jgi:hypothetical protein
VSFTGRGEGDTGQGGHTKVPEEAGGEGRPEHQGRRHPQDRLHQEVRGPMVLDVFLPKSLRYRALFYPTGKLYEADLVSFGI